MLRARQFLTRLISKGASRHNCMRSFDISTSKSGPTLVRFAPSDFQMCFAPHWGAIFRHLNLQKRSDLGVLCTFWLQNVLGATTSCNCSSFIWPDGSAPAALASLFDPPEPQIIGKTQCFATFLPFGAPASSFLWLFLFSDLLSSSLLFSSLLFSSLTLPICFPPVHIVGSSTPKLPSVKIVWGCRIMQTTKFWTWIDFPADLTPLCFAWHSAHLLLFVPLYMPALRDDAAWWSEQKHFNQIWGHQAARVGLSQTGAGQDTTSCKNRGSHRWGNMPVVNESNTAGKAYSLHCSWS